MNNRISFCVNLWLFIFTNTFFDISEAFEYRNLSIPMQTKSNEESSYLSARSSDMYSSDSDIILTGYNTEIDKIVSRLLLQRLTVIDFSK